MSPAITKLPPGVLVEALPDGRVVLRPARRHGVDVVGQQQEDDPDAPAIAVAKGDQ